MKCSNCGNEIKESEKFCSSCGVPVNNDVQNNDVVNNPEPKKNNKTIILAIIVLIVVVACAIGAFVFLSSKDDTKVKEPEKTSEKTTEKPTENQGGNQTENLAGTVKVIKEDKDYKGYELSISNFKEEEKYDFKVSSHVVTLDFDENLDFKVYIDGNYIFDDSVVGFEGYGFLVDIYTLGDYVLFPNHWYTDVKGASIYIIDKSGKLAKKIYDIDNSYSLYEFSAEECFSSSGITVVANRRDDASEYACTNYKEESCAPVSLCDKSEWPKGLTEKSLYSIKYKFEYTNGVLDLKGKMVESQTVEEFIESFDGLLCSSEE